MKPERQILVINAGSSTLKCTVYGVSASHKLSEKPFWRAQVDWRPGAKPKLDVELANGSKQSQELPAIDRRQTVETVLESVFSGKNAVLSQAADLSVIGHRVVHGGRSHMATTQITDALMGDLRGLIELAPLHEPANIEGIEMAQKVFTSARQVAVFDTAFHRTMPESARVYAGPYSWYEHLEVERFGFHGISHQYLGARTLELLPEGSSRNRIITCHIGNGASLCAIKDGKCVMTTMGFTPLEGLVMGTRSGSIDPGILLYLLRQKKYEVEELEEELNHNSGLKGISGLSSDMRDIQDQMAAGNKRAKLAFEIYVDHLAATIASLIPALQGLDVLVFAAGVGENSAQVRSATCERLGFLGVKIDSAKNASTPEDVDISANNSSVKTLVIHTKEDLEIAKECLNFLD